MIFLPNFSAMKLTLIFILLSSLIIGQEREPFTIEIRPRVIDNAKILVNIEITNHLKQPIDYLEGFLSEYSADKILIDEKRIVLIYNYEPALQTGFSTVKTAKFDLRTDEPPTFDFNISKVKFIGESRVFAWHKKAGFIRID